MLSGCEHDPHATSCTMCGHWFEESQIACSVVTCIKVHLEFQDPLNFTFCRQLREKEDLNIAAVFATSLSFVVAFLAANRKWERYKMDNYEDHYDMSCPSTIVSHCLSNRENEIPIETSRNDRLRYEGHEGHEKSQLLGVSPSSFGMLPQMPQMPHIPGIPGMGPMGPMQTPSRQMQMRPRGNWVQDRPMVQWWHKRAMISGIFRNHNSKDSKGTASSFHESWVGDFHVQSVIGTQHKLIGSPTCRWVVVLLCSAIDRYRLCSNKSKGMRDSV